MLNRFNEAALKACLEEIHKLPISEIKYYLLLTFNSIKEADADTYQKFLNELTILSTNLTLFLKQDNLTEAKNYLKGINQSYQNLCEFSKTSTKFIAAGYALINLGSALLAVFTGILGGLIGSVAGLARSIWELNNPLSYLKDGLITGFAFGAAIGFRAPKKIFKNELTRQLKFCLNHLEACIHDMQKEEGKPLSHYKEQVKERLLKDCFSNEKEAYDNFLTNNQNYQIGALPAQFVSKHLEGYLGHHICIILSLPNDQSEVIEFSLGKSDVTNRKLSQEETRTVTGEKIVEMMAFHQKLQETQACTLSYAVTKMKSGENDCFRYIEKILLGTGQETTKLKRFDGTENWIGKNIVGFFVKNLSPFKEDILQEFNYRNG